MALWHMAQGGAGGYTATAGFCFGSMNKMLSELERIRKTKQIQPANVKEHS